MSAWWEFVGWLGACVAVAHHGQRLSDASPYLSREAAEIVDEYNASYELAVEPARAAVGRRRVPVGTKMTERWLLHARLLHRRECQGHS